MSITCQIVVCVGIVPDLRQKLESVGPLENVEHRNIAFRADTGGLQWAEN